MIDTLGWPTLAERRLKTRLIMLCKITHALIDIPNIILIPTDSRTRKSHNQTFRHITTQIKVITKLPNSEQSYKGKVKTHNYINRQNQSTTGKL